MTKSTSDRRGVGERRFARWTAAATAGGLALACLVGAPRPARADCQPATPSQGDVVTCSGAISAGYHVPTGVDVVRVNVLPGTAFTTLDDAIRVNDSSFVQLDGDITITGIGSIAIVAGDDADISTSAPTTILLLTSSAAGIKTGSDGAIDLAGDIIAIQERSQGIIGGQDLTVTSSGNISLAGDLSLGISVGSGGSVLHTGTITLDGADSFAIGGLQDSVLQNDGLIFLGGVSGIGLNVQDDAEAHNLANGRIEILAGATDSIGIQSGDGVRVTNEGVIASAALASTGIIADFDGSITNSGTIWLAGDDAVGMSVGPTGDVLNSASGSVNILGDDGIGVRVGASAVGENYGFIGVNGMNGQGVAITQGATVNTRSQLVNRAGGVILVLGDGAFGVQGGINTSVSNFGTIQVDGDTSTGIDLDSQGHITNVGTIQVAGTDSVGVVVGGDLSSQLIHFQNLRDPTTGVAGSLVSADPDAGPLIRLRPTTGGAARIFNDVSGLIQADTSNIAQAGRGVAIEGSIGSDWISNRGTIEGKILLGDGSDLYVQTTDAVLTDVGTGSLDGGAGTDVLSLQAGSQATGQFDITQTRNFEDMRIEGGSWALSGTANTPGDLFVGLDGTLALMEPLYLDGAYSHEAPTGMGETVEPAMRAFLRKDAAGTPLLHTTGTASLDSRSLEVVVGGGWLGSATYTVLQADGGTGGSMFDDIILPRVPGLYFGAPTYTGNTLLIPVTVAGYTANQLATGAYLDRTGNTGPSPELQGLLDAVDALSYQGYKPAMLQLHGEPYDAHASTTLELASVMTSMMLQHPRYCISPGDKPTIHPDTGMDCRSHRWEPWLDFFGTTGNRTGTDAHISWNDDGAGLLFGVDRRFGSRLMVTGTIGTSYDSVYVDLIGNGRFTTLDVGLAGQYERGPILLQGAVGYGHGWHDRYRNITIPGFARTATGNFSIDRVGVMLQGQYGFDLGHWRLAPLASIDYSALIRSSVNETGASPANLLLDGETYNVVTLRAGGEVEYAFKKDQYWSSLLEFTDGEWRPYAGLVWRQVVSGSDRAITGRFAGAPLAAGQFTVTGDDAAGGFEVSAGVDFTPRSANRLTFGLGYQGFVWKDVSSQNLMGRIRISF